MPAPESKGWIAVILAGAAIGFVMAMQSTSLMNGTSNLWTGAVIASAAGGAAWVMRAYVPQWVRVVAVLAAVLALATSSTWSIRWTRNARKSARFSTDSRRRPPPPTLGAPAPDGVCRP